MGAEVEWTPRVIAMRAATVVRRRLRKEGARVAAAEPLRDSVPAAVRVYIGRSPAPFSRLSAIGLGRADETLLHRFHVLGESPAELAAEAGVSVNAICKRLVSARQRARRLAGVDVSPRDADVAPARALPARRRDQSRRRAGSIATSSTPSPLAADS